MNRAIDEATLLHERLGLPRLAAYKAALTGSNTSRMSMLECTSGRERTRT